MTVAALIAELQKMPQGAECCTANWLSVDVVARPFNSNMPVVILAHISEQRRSYGFIENLKIPEGI